MNYPQGYFRPLESRARLVSFFFWCFIGMSAVVAVGTATAPITGINVNADEPSPLEDTPQGVAVLMLAGIALILYVVILFGCFFVFLMWLYRARRNLPALGAEDVRWSPGWSIAFWFIPIMSLFRPYQVVKETWQASDPKSLPGWRRDPPPDIFGWWWGLFLVYSVGSNMTGENSTSGGATSGFDRTTFFDVAFLMVGIAAAYCAIRIVRDITTRQTQRHQLSAFA